MRTHRLWHSTKWLVFVASCMVLGVQAIDMSGPAYAAAADPEPFVSRAGRFRFLFPGEPAEKTEKTAQIVIHTATYEDANGSAYIVSYFDLDVKGKDPALILEGGVNGMVQAGGWTVLTKKEIKFGKYPGREVTGNVKVPNVKGEAIGITRLIMVNNRMYQVLLIGFKTKVRLSDFKKYLDSFEVLAESPALARATPRRAAPAAPAAPAVSRARRVRQQMQKGAQARRSTPNTPAPGNEPAADAATDDDPGPDPSKPAEMAIAYRSTSGKALDIPSGLNRGRNGQDAFRDAAPVNAVMVGVRVGYTGRGGSKVASIQPIYQLDRSYVEGERQGAPVDGDITVVAKPGYAIGGVNTRTGLLLDAFQLVFMKYNNGRLDPSDSYTSGWLGDPRGGNLKNVSANGKVVVGVHGSTNKREINSLGLVVAQ